MPRPKDVRAPRVPRLPCPSVLVARAGDRDPIACNIFTAADRSPSWLRVGSRPGCDGSGGRPLGPPLNGWQTIVARPPEPPQPRPVRSPCPSRPRLPAVLPLSSSNFPASIIASLLASRVRSKKALLATLSSRKRGLRARLVRLHGHQYETLNRTPLFSIRPQKPPQNARAPGGTRFFAALTGGDHRPKFPPRTPPPSLFSVFLFEADATFCPVG